MLYCLIDESTEHVWTVCPALQMLETFLIVSPNSLMYHRKSLYYSHLEIYKKQ